MTYFQKPVVPIFLTSLIALSCAFFSGPAACAASGISAASKPCKPSKGHGACPQPHSGHVKHKRASTSRKSQPWYSFAYHPHASHSHRKSHYNSIKARQAILTKKITYNGGWFVGVGGGAVWIHLPTNTLVNNGTPVSPPYNQDIYSIGNAQTAMWQANAGYTWKTRRTFLPYLSAYAQYRHYFSTHINGTVTQYSLPEFENYNYRVDYSADLITLNGKFDLYQFKRLMPYLAVGLGTMINHINNYQESALANVTPRVSAGYNGNNTPNLAATLGAGVDIIVSKNYLVTLGYDHVFQGTVKSGVGTSDWSGTSLNFGHPKLDTVFIHISAKIPEGFRT